MHMQEIWSDNIGLAAPGLERGELVTKLSPGLHLGGQSGRLRANLDALWDVMTYARGTSGNRTSATLGANGGLELVNRWFYVDGTASISQQAVSPFGPQLAQAANTNGNNSRVTSYSLSPRINGVLGSDLTYDLRYQVSQTSTAAGLGAVAQGTNGQVSGWSGGLRWRNTSRLFNLATDFSTASNSYSSNQASTQSRIGRIYAYFNPDAHLSFSINVGRETGSGILNGSSSTSGIGFRWQPDPRTTLSGQHNIRYFGADDSFSLSHRFRRAALGVNYSRSRTTSQSLLLQNSTSTYYQILSASLTASVPDPVQRDLLVRQMLQAQGISPFAAPALGFLSDSTMIQRALNISFAVIGVRNTVTFTASRSNSSTDTVPLATDVLATYSGLTQSALGLNWSLRVSPYSTLTASLSQAISNGAGTTGQGASSRQTAANISWNSQMSRHTAGSLALRRVNASGTVVGTGNYRENAATATFGYTY